MNIQSKPNLIFDLDEAVVKGVAHSICTSKADLEWWESKRTKWGAEYPSKEEVEFGCKLARALNKLKEYGGNSKEVHCRILLYECLWKTTNLDECLQSKRVNELLSWWVNGSKIMSANEAESIKQLLIKTVKES